MRGDTHLVTGATTGAAVTSGAVLVGTPVPWALIAGVVTAYSALVPDIDHHSSTVTYSLGPITILLSWLIRGAPALLPFMGDGYLLPWIRCEHRGFTHRPEGWLTFGLIGAIGFGPLLGYPLLWGVAVFAGCATHTWGDCRTLAGVSLRKGDEPTVIGQPFRVERGDYVELGVDRWGNRRVVLSDEARLRRYCYVPVAGLSWIGALFFATWWVLP